MTTTTTYTVCGLSAFERANHPDTCQICGRENLVHPIKVAGGGEVLWVGTGCAANLLYGRTDKVAKSEARKAAKVAQNEVETRERLERNRAHKVEDDRWGQFLLERAGAGDRFEQIQRLGGFAAAREAYRSAS